MILRKLVSSFALIAGVLLCAACSPQRPSDYDSELRQLDAALNGVEPGAERNVATAGRYLYLLYSRATLTGDPAGFARALTVVESMPESLPRMELLRAKLDYQLHRLPEFRRRLAELMQNPDDEIIALNADLATQEGRYDVAQQSYETAIHSEASWDRLARLAYLHGVRGRIDIAQQLYAKAAAQLDARQMRHYAWLEVQQGALEFRRGQFDAARQHYKLADRAYSGYWLVADYSAELAAAERRFDRAIELYRRALVQAPRPELQQALGDVYALAGDATQASLWHERALAGYLESVQRGEVHYLHHLAGFYADVRHDGEEALRWARQDFELRGGPNARDALAWALFRDSQIEASLEQIDAALAAGVSDPHMFFHAAMIHLAAGRAEEGRAFLRKAAAANPRYDSFHVHR